MEPLWYEHPPFLRQDHSRRVTLELRDPKGIFCQYVDVYTPQSSLRASLPLLIAPHPMGWKASEDYLGGIPNLYRRFHRGYFGLVEAYQFILAMPHGRLGPVENTTLASEAQINDLALIPDFLRKHGFQIDFKRIYSCGLSMGGQEALVFAGKYPEILAAVVVFNPIVDLTAWLEDLEITSIKPIQDYQTAEKITLEVGGKPFEKPKEYAIRSASNYIAGISQVPTLLFWSERDAVIPRQTSHHAYRLYQEVKSLNPFSPIAEYNHTSLHGKIDPSLESCWMLHEWCDYEWGDSMVISAREKGTLIASKIPVLLVLF